MGYWTEKEAMAKKAAEHTALMEKEKAEAIAASAAGTIVFGGKDPFPQTDPRSFGDTVFAVTSDDCVTAILREGAKGDGNLAALNFASYKTPGGMFMDGSSAQEEALCHESFLYNVLRQHWSYYDWNRQNMNRALYLDRALWSPDIEFAREPYPAVSCAVITCAAPNFRAASRYRLVSREENSRALHSRIRFIKDIAERTNTDVLIAGAYGCGVFGQDPKEVADLFGQVFRHSSVKKVIFAITPGRNLDIITSVFGEK